MNDNLENIREELLQRLIKADKQEKSEILGSVFEIEELIKMKDIKKGNKADKMCKEK